MATYDEIQALMGGQVDPNSQEAMAQAAALRGQLGDADLMSLSTIGQLQNYGQTQGSAVRSAAGERGRLNRALASEKRNDQRTLNTEGRALKRAIEAENRKAEQSSVERAENFANRVTLNNQQETQRQNAGRRVPETFIRPDGTEVIYDVDTNSGQVFEQGAGFDAEPITPDGLRRKERQGNSAYDGRGTGWLTSRERTAFEDQSKRFMGAVGVIDSFKPKFSQSTIGGKKIEGAPFANELSNFVATNSSFLSDDDQKAKAAWWQDWRNFYENPERNELFGSALTESEQKAWRAANINPSMDAEQIQRGINSINEIIQRKMEVSAENVRIKGAGEDYIQNNLRFITGGDDELKSRSQVTPQAGIQDAPEEALQMLRDDPETADFFEAQFGYLPEGFK